ncbi:hypothetical protein GC167_06030 [bacterium]|nr:hypothetical protein [bacterium]
MLRRPRLFFITLACALWLLNRLAAPDQEGVLSFEAEYPQWPTSAVALSELPERVELKLHGRGFDLAKLALTPKRSLNVSLPFREWDGASDSTLWVDLNGQKDALRVQLPASVVLIAVETPRFPLNLSALHDRRVPVEWTLTRSMRGRYRLSEVQLNPDSVRVMGSDRALAKVRGYQVVWPAKLSEEPPEPVELLLQPHRGSEGIEGITIDPPSVFMRAKPIRWTSSVRDVRLPKPRLAKGLKAVLVPSTAQIFSSGPLSSYEQWSTTGGVIVLEAHKVLKQPGLYKVEYRLAVEDTEVRRVLSVPSAQLFVFEE